MSPNLKDYYLTKQRRKAFYIVENELRNKENPPEVSAVIGLDKELEKAFYKAKRPPEEKPAMYMGIRVNRYTHKTNTKKEIKENKNDDIIKRRITKKNGLHCPSTPTQWINNFDIIIPRAEFA